MPGLLSLQPGRVKVAQLQGFGVECLVWHKVLVYSVTRKVIFCYNTLKERSSNVMCREGKGRRDDINMFVWGNPEQCQVL